MRIPSHKDAYQVLLLRAADEGRGEVLFGDSLAEERTAPQPFLVGEIFPIVYFEHPLIGEPSLDVSVGCNEYALGTRIPSPAAAGSGDMIDWFASIHDAYPDTGCGFELDTKRPELPRAAVHFQPRQHLELVKPFFEAVGEPERAQLYLDLAARMPQGWPLSFFGMFRGRPGFPLRVCGYLSKGERVACAANPQHIADIFDEVGFSGYDDGMLSQVSALIQAAPGSVDFQFDVFPDGSIGSTFAIDVQFKVALPAAVRKTFSEGAGARFMGLLESYGAADSRWRLSVASAFARSVPVELDDGSQGRYAYIIAPHWVKARWTSGVIQPSKMYLIAHGGLL
ncbi:MAG: hypothetical protein K6G78_04145 [bacterium]|nr:hypothetical protein [bacterium]